MKILQFESVGGASGDMILGALADLGVDLQPVRQALSRLAVEEIDLLSEPAESHGLNGTRVTVKAHDHGDSHSHHGHDHDHDPHRNLHDIVHLVRAATLPTLVEQQVIQVFRHLGEAEAAVHQVAIEKIHFHEVGALDSIADIVAGCLALASLDVDRVVVGPLPVGRGTVQCAHGLYPVPAPATLRLLQGYPLVQTDEPYELVTPTGAALLTTWKTHDKPPAGSRVIKVGYGFGQRSLQQRPNVLRAMLLQLDEGLETDTCQVLECNLDDCSPEWVGILTERLLMAGAFDVFTTPIQMKKQRPGMLVTVLCQPHLRESMLDLLFSESTTLGVREYQTQRTVLPREVTTVTTPYGPVRVKRSVWKGTSVTLAPEIDDCRDRASDHDVAVRVVYAAALRAAQDAE